MKKSLLTATAILTMVSVYAQNSKPVRPGMVNMVEKFAAQQASRKLALEKSSQLQSPEIGPQNKAQAFVFPDWNAMIGSANILGVLESSGKPLQYHNELNAISFVHRKSQYYNPSPVPTPSGAATGVIVAQISTDWGTNWDSTCIWNNNNNWARYPQGGLYNPPGNTSLSNAYVVATGPVTQANTSIGWVGSFTASKKLDVYNNIASTVTGAQQFITNKDPLEVNIGKVDYPSYDFTTTDDGKVRALGIMVNDFNSTATGPNGRGFRGANVLTGTFNSATNTFDWKGDSILPNVIIESNTQNPQIIGQPHMAWNDSGTVGYVWFIGCDLGATRNNAGFQPIVFKSTNGGPWNQIPGINFNDTATFNKPVLNHLLAVRLDTTQTIPFFNFTEGMDGTVDKNNRLHIMATLLGTGKNHPDSLGFAFSNFTNADNEVYAYPHSPGQRPYIYDFYQTANSWSVAVIDSMSSEAPGETPTGDGFADNPWSINPETNNKVSSDARLQMSRTPGGSKIIYTWAESDTGRTNFGRKWNHMPNIKVKLMDLNPPFNYSVLPEKYNITAYSASVTNGNPYVKDKAQMHNTSPRCAVTGTAETPTFTTYTITLPIKVSNNPTMAQLAPVTHWYTSAAMEFKIPKPDNVEELAGAFSNALLYPNPTSGNSTLKIKFEKSHNVSISVVNLIGQTVTMTHSKCNAGENLIPITTEGLSQGVYLIKIDADEEHVVKKLIIE